MAIQSVQIESTTTTHVFEATGEQAVIAMFFCNRSTATDCTIDIYLVPAGDVAGYKNQIVSSLPIPAGETYVFDAEKLILADQDTIQARATEDIIVTGTVSHVSTQ